MQGSGLGPALFTVMLSDLKLLSIINILCKFADDTNVLTPEHSDVSLEQEFQHICHWTEINKMVLNKCKTKEIVFRKPSPRHVILPQSLPAIEQVEIANILGVKFTNRLKFDDHVKSLLAQGNQRLYLIKQLKNQGLPLDKLNDIFTALIISKLLYGLPAWGGFLSMENINSINAFLKRAFKCKYCDKLFTINNLLFNADERLFKKVQQHDHCLFRLLPGRVNLNYNIRTRGHELQLPSLSTALHKNSFINRCLFEFK